MSIQEQITAELEDKFEKHPVWVWYDPREKFKGIVDEVRQGIENGNTNVAVFDGSYIELKRRIWEQDPDIEKNWLFYIDESRKDADWFRDIHRLGKEYRPDVDLSDDPAAKYLVERTDEIPDSFDEWRTDPEQLTKAFLTVVFRDDHYTPKGFVVEFFERPEEYADLIDKYGKGEVWEDLLYEKYGIDGRFDPVEIAEQILFGEVESTSPTNRFSELSSDKPEKVKDVCDFWRRQRPKTYVELSEGIAKGPDIEGAVLDSGSLEWDSEAFRQIDDGLLRLCLERMEDTPVMELEDETSEVLDVVDRRTQGFWYEDGHSDYWDVLQHGLRVIEEGSKARDAVSRSHRNPDELGEKYTQEWWTVDSEYRKYVRAKSNLVQSYDGLDEIGDKITHHYTEFVKKLNRDLAKGIQEDPLVGTPQTGFRDEYVTEKDGTAVVICDALRYELARELAESLRDTDADIETEHVSASLPSVTEVGMSSHLGRISLEVDGDLKVSHGGENTNSKSDRVRKFEEAGFEVSDLSDIMNAQTSEIEEEGLTPRVVYSGTIDKLGENVDADEALTQAVDHVDNVETAVRKLLSAGYHNFVVTSDHGFLYTERLPDDLKIESPDDAEVFKRRFAVSEEPLHDDESLVTLDADDMEKLGIEGDGLFLHFPRSVACFKKQGGNMRYFHGGISMQEMAVPCLTLEAEAEESKEEKIDITVKFPTNITNNIVTVEILPEGQMSLTEDRGVILKATADGEEVCDPEGVTVQNETKESLRLKSGKLGDKSSVVFEAVDMETREILEEQRAKVDMLTQDEFDI